MALNLHVTMLLTAKLNAEGMIKRRIDIFHGVTKYHFSFHHIDIAPLLSPS